MWADGHVKQSPRRLCTRDTECARVDGASLAHRARNLLLYRPTGSY